MAGDVVRYVGSKFAADLRKKEVRKGEILTRIPNEDGMYVVEFGDDAFTMPESSLVRYEPTKQELDPLGREPEVVQKKRRRGENES